MFSVWLSLPWLRELASLVTYPVAIAIITGIAYIPGYLNAFQVSSLLLDRQPRFKVQHASLPVTLLIAAWNEEQAIRQTLTQIEKQDYSGEVRVIVVDNNSDDRTAEEARDAASELGLDVQILHESTPGKNHALNRGLRFVETDLVITLDADTLLHPQAIRYLINRYLSSPKDVCAVAGSVLVRNSRKNLLTKMQEWDYFLGIASTKRLQGMYQSTLVAQGAYSLYKTETIREVGGWPDAIGEDIVLTWEFLKRGWKVYFEPLSVAFTVVPETLTHFAKQRSRWARGMIEALKQIKPWENPSGFVRFLTAVDVFVPYLDFTYTLVWLPGLVFAFFGRFWIVGPLTVLVLPLTLLSNLILYLYQKNVFRTLHLRIRRNALGFVFYVVFYQMMMSPIAVAGYLQEAFQTKRVWR